MHDILRSAIAHEFNVEHLEALTRRIASFERTSSYQYFAESAAYCAEELRQAGLAGVEEITLPADGRTTHMDFTMPQAWDATGAELYIIEPPGITRPLVNYTLMPLCLSNRCAPTPPEGVEAEVISVEELHHREHAPGVLVYTAGKPPQYWQESERDPSLSSKSLRAEAADKGALGLISDFSPAREMDPEATYWINGWGSPGWYTTCEDTPLCCFSISPSNGILLANLMLRGPVRVFAKVQSRLYDGAIKTVTALIPGRQEREIVLMAHIYEPFMGDDAIGAAALIEIGRTITTLQKKGILPPLEFGVRLLIGMERYGFAAYFEDEVQRKRTLLGISMDAIGLPPKLTRAEIEVRLSPPSMPFWGDLLLRRLALDALLEYPTVTVPGNLSDDTFISDRTIGIPTQWVWTRVGATHHSSLWLQDEFNDWHLGALIARLVTGYIVRLTTTKQRNAGALVEAMEQSLTGEGTAKVAEWIESLSLNSRKLRQVKRQSEQWFLWQQGRLESFAAMFPDANMASLQDSVEKFKNLLETALSNHREDDYIVGSMEAEVRQIVLHRASLGMPASQAKVPWPERIAESYEQALNWADGTRTVADIAALTQPLATPAEEEEWLRRFMRYCRLMEKYGYLRLEKTR